MPDAIVWQESRAMNQTDLHVLIGRAKQKDKEAIIKLYREFCDRVYFYCFKILGEQSKAALAVYEIFAGLFENIDKTGSAEDFYTELNSIMVKVCKTGPDTAFDILSEESLFAEAAAGYELNSTDVAQTISKIDSLPETQKRIVILFYYEKLTSEQIAEIEGISESEVLEELDRAGAAVCSGQNHIIADALSGSAVISRVPENINRWITEKLTADAMRHEKPICSRLKKPVFLKIRVRHLLIVVLAAIAAVVYMCVGCRAQTVPAEAGDSYMTVSLADFPDEIREQTAYFSTGFYQNLNLKVTPELAYIRTAGGYGYYEDNWLNPVEETMEICWYDNNTNVLCLFNRAKEPIAYIYGFSPGGSKPEDYPDKLKLHTGFEIDCKAVMNKAVSDTGDMMKDIYILDEENMCIRYSEANEAYILDINYDSVPFTEDEVTGNKIMYTDASVSEAEEAFVFVLSKYWLGDGKLMGEEIYNNKGRGLNMLGYGEYCVNNDENFYDRIFVAVYSGEGLIAAGCLDALKMDIPDYEN